MTIEERLEDAVSRVERAGALDGPAKALTSIGQRLLAPERVRSALSGRKLGHPLHPGLTLVSGGALFAATMLDVLGGRAGRAGSTRLLSVGLVAAIPTAASGWSDWLDTEDAERRVGFVHAASNSIALLAYARSRQVRRSGRRGMASSLGGAAALTAGGWLGGHLAYALGLGVDTTAFQHAVTEWTDAAASSDVDERPSRVWVEGVPLLLCRVHGDVVALAERCTHRGGPLSEGTRVGDVVTCPWHDSAFSLRSGAVLRGPACRPQPTYEVEDIGGRIRVRRSEPRSLRRHPIGR
jgi:nitrite reductase/ring-hydroxylating ferredoxin subunit